MHLSLKTYWTLMFDILLSFDWPTNVYMRFPRFCPVKWQFSRVATRSAWPLRPPSPRGCFVMPQTIPPPAAFMWRMGSALTDRQNVPPDDTSPRQSSDRAAVRTRRHLVVWPWQTACGPSQRASMFTAFPRVWRTRTRTWTSSLTWPWWQGACPLRSWSPTPWRWRSLTRTNRPCVSLWEIHT